MKMEMRNAVASLMVAAISASLPAMSQQSAVAMHHQEKKMLSTEKEKVSYAIGLDISRARLFELIGDDIDVSALQRGIENTLKGGKPLISEAVAHETDTALRAVLAARSEQQQASGSAAPAPSVSKENVGLLLGSYMVGPSLLAIKDDIDLPVVLQAVRTSFAKDTPLMDEHEAATVMQAFVASKNAVISRRNRDEGNAFLSKNKDAKGVVTTASGLQYMVLRQGSGARPTPSSKVRVNYEGKLLDGQVFDSSYQRGQPAEFGLDQVIKGWSEGLLLMPVGAKYRFWVPSPLAYGEQGTPGGPIGPDTTLTFDVELLSILP
ncbi:MAG TPA: FKBP-type peptidyl-prolyl cis-trans isomerase [Xylella sp.]